MPEPGLAAKKLLDLAQAYGTKQSLSVIVVRLLPPSPAPQFYTPVVVSSKLHPKVSVSESDKLKNCVNLDNSSSYSGKMFSAGLVKDRKTTHKGRFNRTLDTPEGSHSFSEIEVQENFLSNITSKNKNIGFGIDGKTSLKGKMIPQANSNLEEFDRSSPSGQSQSDNSEHDSDMHQHTDARTHESNLVGHHKSLCKSIEDLYAKPHRRKWDASRIVEPNQRTNGVHKAVTYYHYPRPDPNIPSPQNHLTDHLLTMNQSVHTAGVLAPPAGFGDPESDSEGSDSGLSGVSGGHQRHGQKHLEDDMSDGHGQVGQHYYY